MTQRFLVKREAFLHERPWVERSAKWCHDKAKTYAGLVYDDPVISPQGKKFYLMVTSDTPETQIQDALEQAHCLTDVLLHEVLVCPGDWLQIAPEPA